jgi:peptide-methionine (S)-S-oxide reductase
MKALLRMLSILALVPATLGAAPQERVVLAGGCFWGMEAVFDSLKGVTRVVSGYSGGNAAMAHYEIVSTGMTGHAESVEITYDPSRVSFAQLLKVYFLVAHDPTELNRQGPDEGTQYRSAIFYTTPQQKATAESTIRQLARAKTYAAPIVTQVVPLRAFYPAEAYHQHFIEHHPDDQYVVYNDLPKLEQLHHRFPELVKPSARVARRAGVTP